MAELSAFLVYTVIVYWLVTKLAVSVPGPFTVRVVERDDELATLSIPDTVQELKE
jgi:hypothetical protein